MRITALTKLSEIVEAADSKEQAAAMAYKKGIHEMFPYREAFEQLAYQLRQVVEHSFDCPARRQAQEVLNHIEQRVREHQRSLQDRACE